MLAQAHLIVLIRVRQPKSALPAFQHSSVTVTVVEIDSFRTELFYCKRFAQSAGPWFGHRFAQSAGPRPPLRSVRCVMEISCVSQPLCHPFALLCEFRTLFDTVFRSFGSLLEDPSTTFFNLKSKQATLGTPV